MPLALLSFLGALSLLTLLHLGPPRTGAQDGVALSAGRGAGTQASLAPLSQSTPASSFREAGRRSAASTGNALDAVAPLSPRPLIASSPATSQAGRQDLSCEQLAQGHRHCVTTTQASVDIAAKPDAGQAAANPPSRSGASEQPAQKSAEPAQTQGSTNAAGAGAGGSEQPAQKQGETTQTQSSTNAAGAGAGGGDQAPQKQGETTQAQGSTNPTNSQPAHRAPEAAAPAATSANSFRAVQEAGSRARAANPEPAASNSNPTPPAAGQASAQQEQLNSLSADMSLSSAAVKDGEALKAQPPASESLQRQSAPASSVDPRLRREPAAAKAEPAAPPASSREADKQAPLQNVDKSAVNAADAGLQARPDGLQTPPQPSVLNQLTQQTEGQNLESIAESARRFAERQAGAASSPRLSNRPVSPAGLIWPAEGPISSHFGPGHPLGIDIDFAKDPFQPVLAAAAGEVVFAGGNACCSYGLYVVVDHGHGFTTLYSHFSEIKVQAGQVVPQGAVLGLGGRTGHATGHHLHFELRINGTPVNPMHYLP
jgi:murein DD-endopeptidase MepM/ murein hydrolase activator NlpD